MTGWRLIVSLGRASRWTVELVAAAWVCADAHRGEVADELRVVVVRGMKHWRTMLALILMLVLAASQTSQSRPQDTIRRLVVL
ncbi:MAG TPA: hypothetical protein VNT27_02960 [Propionibacteriaceae bacterium]|nr:hypothetical protein [Propionibacteriaceae bacterium]